MRFGPVLMLLLTASPPALFAQDAQIGETREEEARILRWEKRVSVYLRSNGGRLQIVGVDRES